MIGLFCGGAGGSWTRVRNYSTFSTTRLVSSLISLKHADRHAKLKLVWFNLVLRSSNSGFHTISFWFDSALSPSYERKLGSEGYEQVIKLLKRIVRRLRLFFCGLFTRPTAPRRAPWASLIPSNPESAPKSFGSLSKNPRKEKKLFINQRS